MRSDINFVCITVCHPPPTRRPRVGGPARAPSAGPHVRAGPAGRPRGLVGRMRGRNDSIQLFATECEAQLQRMAAAPAEEE